MFIGSTYPQQNNFPKILIMIAFILVMSFGTKIVFADKDGLHDSHYSGVEIFCVDNPQYQVAGSKPGSYCALPVIGIGVTNRSSNYRYGRTKEVGSESRSTMIEDYIKVTAVRYKEPNAIYQNGCQHDDTNGDFVACGTNGANPVQSGNTYSQDGSHIFQTAGYVDSNLHTGDTWTQP